MKAPHVYVVHYEGRDVECYGDLEEDSNFSIVCYDECDDDIWCDSNPVGDSFTSWEEVVSTLQGYFNSDILEISAC
jgi:hypothetical protein